MAQNVCCPNITVSVILGNFYPDGSRDVTLNTTVSSNGANCPQCTLKWDFGDAQGAGDFSFPFDPSGPTVTIPAANRYMVCGRSYNALLTVTCSDEGCNAIPITVDVPCLNCCPTVVVQAISTGPCDSTGRQPTTLQFTITPALDPDCPTYDGTLSIPGYGNIIISPIVPGTGPITEQVTLSYLPGNYNAVFSINSTSICQDLNLPFVISPCDCCPTIDLKITVGNCDPATATTPVTISYIVIPSADPACATLSETIHIPGLSPIIISGSGTISNTVTVSLSAGNYDIICTNSPGLCPDKKFHFVVPPCANSGCCPTLVVTPHIKPCIAGKHPVVVDYVITQQPNCPQITGILSIGGISTSIGALSGTVVLPDQLPGSIAATLTLTSPDGCGSITANVTIPPCNCCPIASTNITSSVNKQCNDDGVTKGVTINAVVTPIAHSGCPTLTSAVLYVDGVQKDSKLGSGILTLSNSDKYSCGIHTVTVSYPGTGCPDDSGTFCVPVCEKSVDYLNRIKFESLATAALIVWILYIFNSFFIVLPIVAGIFTLLAILVYVLSWRPWTKPCKNCLYLIVLWEILLASFLGFLCLSKTSLLPLWTWTPFYVAIIILLIIIIILIIIYLLYRLWVAKCCPTDCDKLTALCESLAFCLIALGFIKLAFISTGLWHLFLVNFILWGTTISLLSIIGVFILPYFVIKLIAKCLKL